MRDYTQLYFDAVDTDDIHKLMKELIIENKKLHIENNYYRNIEHFLLKKDVNENYKLTFKYDETPMAFDSLKMSGNILHFMTITFDPKRFDNLHLTSSEEQQNYILYQLHLIRRSINFLYGCFEKQKNDIMHAHLLMNVNDLDEFKKILKIFKAAFTYNINNLYTIDFQPVKQLDRVLWYIDDGDKVKFGFFQYYNLSNYL